MRAARGHLARPTAVGIAILGLLLSGCANEPPMPPAVTATESADTVLDGEEWLVYHAFDGSETSLRLARPDGTGDHALLSDPPGEATHPDWSPDGTHLVFTVDARELWTVGADGTGLTQLPVECDPDCYLLDGPAWSPDGTRVAYTHITLPDGGLPHTTIEQIELSTGTVDVLYDVPEPLQLVLQVRWASSGNQLVHDLYRYPSVDASSPDGTAIAVLDLKSGESAPITEWSMFAVYPDWSPDGESIVFSTYDLGDRDHGAASDPFAASDLYTVAPKGTDLRQLTSNETSDALVRNDSASGPLSAQPTWAPDGESIVFVQVDGDTWPGWGLATITVDGDISPAIGDTYVQGTHPRWRPGADRQ